MYKLDAIICNDAVVNKKCLSSRISLSLVNVCLYYYIGERTGLTRKRNIL